MILNKKKYRPIHSSQICLLVLFILATFLQNHAQCRKTKADSEDLAHLRDQLKKLMAQQQIYNLIKKNGKLMKLAQQDTQDEPEQVSPEDPPQSADPATPDPPIEPDPPVEDPPAADATPDSSPEEAPSEAEEPPTEASPEEAPADTQATGSGDSGEDGQTEATQNGVEEAEKGSSDDPESAGEVGGDNPEEAGEADGVPTEEQPANAETEEAKPEEQASEDGTGEAETTTEAGTGGDAEAEEKETSEETTTEEKKPEKSECEESDTKDECMEKKLKSKLVHLLSVFDNLYSSMEEVCQTSESVCKKILDRIKEFENLRPETNEAELSAILTQTIKETSDNVFEIAKQQLEIKGEDNISKLRVLIDEERKRIDKGFQTQLSKFEDEESLKNQVSSQTTKVLKNTVESFYLNDYLKGSESEESSEESEAEDETKEEDPEDSLIKEIMGDAQGTDKLTALAEKEARVKKKKGAKKKKRKKAARKKESGLNLDALSDKTTLELLSSLLK